MSPYGWGAVGAWLRGTRQKDASIIYNLPQPVETNSKEVEDTPLWSFAMDKLKGA